MRFEGGEDGVGGDSGGGIGDVGTGTGGNGGRSRVTGRGEALPAIQNATVRNADAVMVRACVRACVSYTGI